MTQPATKKFEGIITDAVLEKTNKETPELEQQYVDFYSMMQVFEPKVMADITSRGNEAREHFRRLGITGKNLDELTDALKTFYIRGLMVYRNAISLWDAKKLDEIYGEDYEAYQDRLIDEALRRKAEAKANEPLIESIEPEKDLPHDLDDLMGE
jgi:hypothetical protein